MLASCWVARKIFLSPARASSRARTHDSLPTTNGVIMNGKITTSRMGIIGSFLVSNFSRWVTGTALSYRAPPPWGRSEHELLDIVRSPSAGDPYDSLRITRKAAGVGGL